MATVKIVPLLFALHSDKIRTKQLKSLQNHGSLNHINSSEGRVSRQKSLPKEALSLSLIAPGTDSESYSAALISKAGGWRWQMYRQRWCPSYGRLWKIQGYHWHLEQWWARDSKWGWEGNATPVFAGSPWQAGKADYAVSVIAAAHNKKPHTVCIPTKVSIYKVEEGRFHLQVLFLSCFVI